jgi:hypothetical protein
VARLPGEFGDTLRHCARRAQRHVHMAIQVAGEPARDHRMVVTDPGVVRVGLGTRAFAVAPGPHDRNAPVLQHRTDGRVAGKLAERLDGHCGCLLRPFGHDARGGPPGSDELPHRVVASAAHSPIVSLRACGDQHAQVTHLIRAAGSTPHPGYQDAQVITGHGNATGLATYVLEEASRSSRLAG